MELVSEETIRALVAATVDRERARIQRALPGIDVQHIGATAVPGSLTKGDLDLMVRVPQAGFDAATWKLTDLFSIHQIENWGATFASFINPDSEEIPLGVQLVVIGSEDERIFLAWRDLLRGDEGIRRRYDQLKECFAHADQEIYRRAKEVFIQSTLSEIERRDQERSG